ncbi:MAG: hypothetical protein FWE61_01625 [Micrococcales bacterium]|nr:hypothetical protein [Micrococcales bacterium]
MKSIRTTTIALAGTVLLSFGVLAGCSSSSDDKADDKGDQTEETQGADDGKSDDKAGGGSQAFCTPDPATIDPTDPNASLQFYKDWAATAPADVKDSFDIIIAALDGDMSAMGSQDYMDAVTKIGEKVAEVCR